MSDFLLYIMNLFLLSFQTNLKADSTTKTLLQRCQDLVKIIDEYPAKVSVYVLSWLSVWIQ